MENKTPKEIIELADELNPNSYSDDIKAQWINEVETYIQTEIYSIAPTDVVTYYPYEDNKDKELSLDSTNDKIYLTYLQAMIDFSNKEYAAFNNDVALYNTYLDTYAKWYQRTHEEGKPLVSGMYVSAYGIALKHGFVGTEDDWLESLGVTEVVAREAGKFTRIGIMYNGDRSVVFDIPHGHGLEIKGLADSAEALPAEDVKKGDIWQVGEAQELYLWNGEEWINIGTYKGEKGEKGAVGPQGEKGEKGDTGAGIEDIEIKRVGKYTIVTFIYDNGQRSMSFNIPNGEDGDTGPQGEKGEDGEDGVGIIGYYTLPYDGGRTVCLTMSNGQEYSFEVMDGADGEKGEDGYTPVKGTDYWTEEDKAEIKAYVDEEVGDIDKALEEIIALQESFIGTPTEMITFELLGKEYTCPKGMTWAELETYNNGEIWKANNLSINSYVVNGTTYSDIYTGDYTLATWSPSPIDGVVSGGTHPTDVIRDISEGYFYAI